MMRKTLFPVLAVMAWGVFSCSSAPAAQEQTSTDSLACVINKEGIEATVTADYPAADSMLQEALATFMRSMMPTEVADVAAEDGQALLAACADAAWAYMSDPQTEGDEAGIDIILGEGRPDEDAGLATAEELAEHDGGFPRSTFSVAFPKVYESAEHITWQCSWNLYAEGTPHPAFGLTGATFRKSDGRRLGHDIFKDTDSEGFRQLLKESLRQWLAEEWEWKDATDQQMAEALQEGISLDSLPLPVNAPFLLPEGVALPYQEWELTGSRDIQVLILPYDKIKSYMKTEY